MPRRPRVRFAKDYELPDVVDLFQRRAWHSWSELVDWLRTKGPFDDSLTPGEVARLYADFSVLAAERVPFVADPGTAYELAQEHRRTTAVLAALQWIEEIQALRREGLASADSTCRSG